MNNLILYKSYSEPPICEGEILRYAGVKKPDNMTLELMKSAVSEAEKIISYKVCYCELPIEIMEDCCDIGGIKINSKNLAERLKGCDTAIIFAATLGVHIDRLITKYSKISPAKALMFQALGTERIEALCDTFCSDIESEREVALTSRFSAGYGDLSIEYQKDIFSLLNCEKRIGLTLNDSFFMSPSKSVTAICGVSEKPQPDRKNKCSTCEKTECIYRGKV